MQKYTISFNSDGGSRLPSQEVYWGDCVSQVENPIKTGYTFSGWFYQTNSGESEFFFTQAITQDIEVKAKWTVNSYKIIFNKNEAQKGSMQTLFCFYDEKYTLPQNTFSKLGNTFSGWSYESSGSVRFNDGECVKDLTSENDGTVTLYAVWKENPYHIIYYENLIDAENAEENPVKFLENQNIYIYEPQERSNYIFGGWFFTDDFSGNKTTGWNAGDYSEDVRLYAKWIPVSYQVTLNDRGNLTEYQIEFGQKLPPFIVPDVEGATFMGFYTEEYANGEQYINLNGLQSKIFESASDITLYASWEYKINYIIEKNLNIPYINSNPQVYSGEREIILSEITVRTGYKFLGWKDENGRIITKIEKGTSGARTITSKGFAYEFYSITYNKNDGEWEDYTPIETFTVASNTIYLPFSLNIKKTGYNFEGWYETEDFTGEKITVIPSLSTRNYILYAKWTEN
jgi:uncharacterized repeat protein (TIGR02543 family)